MYEGHFNLRGRPFLAAPDSAQYFPGVTIELARRTLIRSIARGEGPGLVIGAPGTGKSLLCQLIAEEFSAKFAVALLISGRFGTRAALLQAILHQLRLPYRGVEEGELRLSLVDCLDPAAGQHEGLLLIVDEAHLLPWKVLEEIRLLTNLVRDSQPRVRVVITGNSVLEERFANPKLSSFSQRLAARCYLGAMDATETAAYVRAQIAFVGGDADGLLDDDALRAVHRASDGVPRLVNQICDHALIMACVAGLHRLNDAAIDEAWADLQQLPAPWSAKPTDAPSNGVVEFGGLDDMGDEQLTAIPFPTAGPRQHPFAAAQDDLDAMEVPLPEAESDDPFQPAGSIGGEVDLDIGEFGDPFSEQFAQEEVILDHYGAQTDVFCTRPRTTSSEGRELGEMLASWAARQPGAAASVRLGPVAVPPALVDEISAAAEDSSEVCEVHASRQVSSTGEIEAWPTGEEEISSAQAELAPPIAPSPKPADSGDRVSWRQSFNQGQLKQVSLARGASSLLTDRHILVVEDEQQRSIIVDRAPSAHAPLGRKREYRQLFAKLRRE